MQSTYSTVASQLYQRFQQVIAEDLIRSAQTGDMHAHNEIYNVFSQAVFTLAHGMCRNPQCAEDVLHNTFVKLIHKIATFKFQAPFGMWLRQIAVNESLMHLRKQKKHNLTLSSDEFDMFEGMDFEQFDSLSRNSSGNDSRHSDQLDLATVLAALPEQTRNVLWLKEVEGYTHQEIADMMGRTPSYSKSITARAYKFLQQRVKQTSTGQ